MDKFKPGSMNFDTDSIFTTCCISLAGNQNEAHNMYVNTLLKVDSPPSNSRDQFRLSKSFSQKLVLFEAILALKNRKYLHTCPNAANLHVKCRHRSCDLKKTTQYEGEEGIYTLLLSRRHVSMKEESACKFTDPNH